MSQWIDGIEIKGGHKAGRSKSFGKHGFRGAFECVNDFFTTRQHTPLHCTQNLEKASDIHCTISAIKSQAKSRFATHVSVAKGYNFRAPLQNLKFDDFL